MISLRHAPLAFWVSLTAVLAAAAALALVLGASAPSPAAAGASPTQQRQELLELRTQLAYLAALARQPGQELADEAAALSGAALQAAERSSGPLSDGYRDLSGQLAELEQFVLEQFVLEQFVPDRAELGQTSFGSTLSGRSDESHTGVVGAEPDERVRLSQLPDVSLTLPEPGEQLPGESLSEGLSEGLSDGLSDARDEVVRKVARVLASADRLVPLTWR